MPNLSFSDRIIRWYRANKRDLPWRQTHDPYRIWISEIILQQTRVDQGMDYYHRLLEAFPTVTDLANADLDQVLKLWQGLGYYSRARNLHATAQWIAGPLKGKFPSNYKDLLALKGVGPYTAAAIASFCFNEPVAVVDGNVERVLARYFGVEEPVDASATKKLLQQLAQEHIAFQRPAEHNQAIMEFGALQCTPKNPSCANCPLQASCFALRLGKVSDLPFKAKRTQVKAVAIDYFVLTDGRELLLRKRVDQGIWNNLHDFLSIEGEAPLTDSAVQREAKKFGEWRASTETVVHLLSHRKLSIRFHVVQVKRWEQWPNGVLVKIQNRHELAVPKPIHDFLMEVGGPIWSGVRKKN